MKKTYSVGGVVSIFVYTHVEASSKKEAIELAAQKGVQTLCFHCTRKDPHELWVVASSELDGEVKIERKSVEEVEG